MTLVSPASNEADDEGFRTLSGAYSPKVLAIARKARKTVRPVWDAVDDLVLANQARVLDAFVNERVALHHLSPSTGYGYGDSGRDALDRVYARVFGAEAAMVRFHWASGTHVLKTALFALLRPGDGLLYVTGKPYETMMPVIGTRAESGCAGIVEPCAREASVSQDVSTGEKTPRMPFGSGSLREFGISYKETGALLEYQEGRISLSELETKVEEALTARTKVVMVQRSRGYTSRKSVTMETLERFLALATEKWPALYTVVDNCYCEFAQDREPPAAGASLTAGSLIKNPGGGICPTGGYVAGTSECVARVADALYAPGLGSEVGSNPYGYRDAFQGLFMAPRTVGESLRGAAFAAAFFQEMGYPVDPTPLELRTDIVQAITVGSPEKLKALARAIQAASPVDSFAAPEPWDMPGYINQVIMAAGCFVQGSSIELSCDAPYTPPYTGYLQGGLSKEHVVLACLKAGEALLSLRK